MGSFTDRLRHAWNAFTSNEHQRTFPDIGGGFSYRPDRRKITPSNEKSIVNAVINRIAVDAAGLSIEHCRVDDNGKYIGTVDSGLNKCLTFEANRDQTGRAFRQDMFLSLLDEGVIAVVPVETDLDPKKGSFEITAMRVGKIIQWYPEYVTVRLYNQDRGLQEDVTLAKKMVAIIENPFYAVMNEPNSTAKRLIRKMNLMDNIDEQIGSQKLDLIIQLPYTTRTDTRQRQAEIRRKAIEDQLVGSKYGIAYLDGTERITQINRPVENNLESQVENLTSMLYSQLGITKEVLDGSATEEVMNNYYSRTVEPLLNAVIDEFVRKFLTKNARTRGQSILFFRDPFKLMPTSSLAEIADSLTRNEILTSNEMRQIIGLKPADDPNADALLNKNLNHPELEGDPNQNGLDGLGMNGDEIDWSDMTEEEYQAAMQQFDEVDAQLDDLERQAR